MKELRVVDEDWDWLIILDACRYDVFRDVYSEYLNGSLEKRYSLASNTPNWLVRNFTDYYDDIEYISSNSFINKENIPLHKSTNNPDREELRNWYPKHRFRKIHDLSAYHWFDDSGSSRVEPEDVVEYCLENDFEPDTRKIVHFIQPHKPYLDSYSFNKFHWFLKEIYEKVENEEIRNMIFRSFRSMVGDFWYKQHRKRYYHNLRRALDSISMLVDYLEGRVFISADHGECLGEHNTVGHPEKEYKELREVPWFEVDKR